MSDDTLRIVNQPGNLLRTVQNMIDQDGAGQLFRATVVAITDNTVRIQRTGHDPDVAQYAVLDNFPYPQVGDEVLMARVGSGWMVVGSVLRSGLAENYLKIETKLTLSPGGSIEDADGSIWDQAGIRLVTDALGTDTLQFLSTDWPSILQLGGLIAETSAQVSMQAPLEEAAAVTFDQVVARANYTGIAERSGVLRIATNQMTTTVFKDDDNWHAGRMIMTATIRDDGSSPTALLTLGSLATDGGDPDDILNIRINNGTNLPAGQGVILFGNSPTVPPSNPVGGGYLYVVAGALTWRGSSGTITTIAVA